MGHLDQDQGHIEIKNLTTKLIPHDKKYTRQEYSLLNKNILFIYSRQSKYTVVMI